jgi:hypothetical protein
MKIKIETTIEINKDDFKSLKSYFNEVSEEGESFRDWYKSMFVACGHAWMDETIYNYGEIK